MPTAKSLFLVIVMPWLVVAADELSKESPDFDQPVKVQVVLEELARLSPADQKMWLERMEKRAQKVAGLMFKPGEASLYRSKVRSMLHQKTVTWQTLAELVEDLDAKERATIVQLSQKYRNLVFEIFYRELDVYGEWQQAWRDVQSAWQQAGCPFDQQDLLLDWLERAIKNVSSPKIGPIPEKPKFISVDTAQRPVEDVKKTTSEESANTTSKPSIEEQQKLKQEPPSQPTDSSENTSNNTPTPEKPAEKAENSPPTTKTTLPATENKQSEGKTSEPKVEIKLDELAVRIAGWNLSFRALETDIDELDDDVSIEKLESLVDRLAVLIVRRQDLSLFREAVPAEKRNTLEELSSPKIAIAQITERISKTRQKTEEKDHQDTSESKTALLKRLDKLLQRVKELAEK